VNAAASPAACSAQPNESLTIARNVSTRYLAIGTEAVLGLLVLPFNIEHLGTSAYGLWMLAATVTTYFSILDMGYSGALLKFVAQYRARRDERALNEVLSTTFCLFTVFGILMYVAAIGLSLVVDRVFHIAPEQVAVARTVLLIVSLHVAAGTIFGVYGGVINGFQRYDLNNIVGTISSVVTAAANVVVLLLGYGLIELVAVTTAVRLLTCFVYRANAYRVFPGLQTRLSLFRLERLREMTGFSVYMLVIDWANKLNYTVDALVIGAFLGTTAVAVWTVGQRLGDLTHRLANQLNEVLFPSIVDNDVAARAARLQRIFVVGTRLSLAVVVPMAGALILLAHPLVHSWVGAEFAGSVAVVQLLAVTVIVRVGASTSNTILKGAGRHRLIALTTTATGLCNLGLSIALVRPFGLVGVAVGTLVPVCLMAMLVTFPAGCRRVGLPVTRAMATAVWPAVWPAFFMAVVLGAVRHLVAGSLVAVAAACVVGGVVYGTTFVMFSISAEERRAYLAQLSQLTWRSRFQPVSESI
jgi:O-antigen/teichoic acid export membrane protein